MASFVVVFIHLLINSSHCSYSLGVQQESDHLNDKPAMDVVFSQAKS